MTKNVVQVIAFVCIAIAYLGFGFYYLYTMPSHTVKYDCTWVEIQPDIPPKVREECRKKLSGRI